MDAAHYKIRPAGPFLIAIGLSLFTAMTFADAAHPHANQNVFLIGMGLSFVILYGTAFLQGFKPFTPRQRMGMSVAILLELGLFIARPHITGPLTPAGNWMAALLIVGVHFLPFALALGAELALLGVLCSLNALLAMTNWTTPEVWLSIDAVLKIAVGLLIWVRPRRAALAVEAGGA